jgi:protein-disulfide isomerase
MAIMKVFAAVLLAFLPCLAVAPEVDKGKMAGNPSAPIRIEIFSDFQCPACKALHDQLLPVLLKDYVIPGKVCLVYREFPLAMHPHAREAAHYATAAARLGIYQPVADRIFLQQATWAANGKVWDTVASVLSPEQQKKVQTLAKDPAIIASVQQDVQLGQRERVSSTPTMILTHGTKKFPLPWPVNYNFLRSLLDGYLR